MKQTKTTTSVSQEVEKAYLRQAIDTASLGDITTLAQRAAELDRQLIAAEALVARLREQRQQVLTKDLPDLMAGINMQSFTTNDGIKIRIDTIYSCKIINPEAFEWLDSAGHSGIIKVDVVCSYGRARLEEAKALNDRLTADGVPSELKQNVHPQTLKAFTREQYENGNTLPSELFNVFVGRIASISR
jgi:hypothetical protein